MFRFVLGAVLLLVAIAFVVVGTKAVDDGYGKETHVPFRKLAAIPLLLGLLFIAWSTVRIVGAGEVGIPVANGHVESPRESGFAFVPPWASVKKMNIRTQTYTMSASTSEGAKSGDDSIAALTRDGANVTLDATLVYHLEHDQASQVYRKLGTNYTELLRSTTRTAIRAAAGQFDAIPLGTSDRASVSKIVASEVRSKLGARGIIVEDFQLRNVKLPPELQAAVNARLQAQQSAEAQEFELQKTEKQADIRRAEAQGLADAQRIINSTLTPAYLQYLYTKNLEEMSKSPNHSTIIVPFDKNLTPMLNVGNG